MDGTTKDLPGKEGSTFKIILPYVNSDFWLEAEIKLEVISVPVKHRYQWYWKILHYFTLTLFFGKYYTYKVKLLKHEHTSSTR